MAVTTVESSAKVEQRVGQASHRQGWVWQVTGLCLVLGCLLGLAIRTQWQLRASQLPGTRFSTLAPFYIEQKNANERLQGEITSLRKQASEFERELGKRGEDAQLLHDQLEGAKLLAGMIALEGPGLEITLRDSPHIGRRTLGVEDAEARVHDQDINAIVSELKAAGAEAIAISGADKTQKQRVIALTTARCAGPGVKVNDAVFGAPYTIWAIGNPLELESQLKLPNGVLDASGLKYLDMIRIVHQEEIQIPAYSGATIHFRYAKPSE